MANGKQGDNMKNIICGLTDAQIATIIENEMTQEDIEADRKMKIALNAAPRPILKAWKIADKLLGTFSIQELDTPMCQLVTELCWTLSDYAEELYARKRKETEELARICCMDSGFAKFHAWEEVLRKWRATKRLEQELGRPATQEEIDAELNK